MKTPRFVIVFVAAALALATCPRLAAQGSGNNYVVVEKDMVFDQVASGATLADPWTPFQFHANSPVAFSFTPPGLASVACLLSTYSSNYEYSQSFGAQSAMDAAFPNGTYSFSVSGHPGFTLALTGNSYPNVPEIMGGTWNSSGQLVVDPTQTVTLNFNSFANYGMSGAGSHEEIQIQTIDGNLVSLDQGYTTPGNPSPFASYVIPAGTLAPGSAYQCELQFATAPAFNTTDVSGDTCATVYSVTTYFTIVTSGTPASPPTITQQPTSQTAPVGSSVTFGVQFSGSNVGIQWYKNGLAYGGPNNNTGGGEVSINSVQNSDAGSYFAILVSSGGSYVQTNTVTLTIGSGGGGSPAAPSFTTQPSSQTISDGGTVIFSVGVAGSPSPACQWYFGGNALSDGNGISGSATATLVISGAGAANVGNYYCTATNSSGSVQSNTATLSLAATPDVGRLVNISCRAQVGTGGNILIAGFVIGGGAGSEPVLVRGSGPALAQFGVGGTLADPQLQLYSGSTVLGTNNGWGGAAAITSAASAVGAFGWSSASSHDSALLESMPAGAYTAQVAGQSGDTGVALVELYDATPSGTYTPSSPRLINISTRVNVGTGGNILIAGFVIGGSTSETLLIRASGPALTQFGVGGTLPDPQLKLYTGSTLLGTSNGWFGNLAVANAAASVGAFPWSDPSSHDSAILVTLAPGAYTAQVSGASGDTGVALIEVYEVR